MGRIGATLANKGTILQDKRGDEAIWETWTATWGKVDLPDLTYLAVLVAMGWARHPGLQSLPGRWPTEGIVPHGDGYATPSVSLP
jgi:hypothetical protein